VLRATLDDSDEVNVSSSLVFGGGGRGEGGVLIGGLAWARG
jgi:hypothetical protein